MTAHALADTCVWIELISDTATGRRYRPVFADMTQMLVPTLVLFELHRWALRELDEERTDRILATARSGVVVMLDDDTALHGALLSREHGLSSVEALIYASALRAGAELVTCDAHFKSLARVAYQPRLLA